MSTTDNKHKKQQEKDKKEIPQSQMRCVMVSLIKKNESYEKGSATYQQRLWLVGIIWLIFFHVFCVI